MKKTTKFLSLLVVIAMMVAAVATLAACGPSYDLGHGEKEITIWVSESEGVKDLTQKQLEAWLDTKEGYRDTYKLIVEGQTESESATQMVTDVASGADIYCFAQDQLARLVEAKALIELEGEELAFVNSNNDQGSVNATKVAGKVYGYPITADNGYFMYYDKSVVKADHINDLAAIVKDCEDAGKKFSFELGGSAWYTASFFFATGCSSSWTFNPETNKWKAADNFNSEKGIAAMKGMQILTKSSAWVDSSKAADFGAAVPSAVVVTGTWDSSTAKENLGDNYAVAKLPKFTVDGESYQLGSFSGYKIMGLKPQTDSAKLAVCKEIAQLLSGKQAQEERFDLKGWGPSNKEVQALQKVKDDEALTALAAQNAFATPQGNINGGWWDFAKLLGTASKDAADDAALQAALDSYSDSIKKYETMSVEAVKAWGVVGAIAGLAGVKENLAEGQTEWADWNTDIAMVKQENSTDALEIYKSKVAIDLKTTDQFKIRHGQGWDANYGAAGDVEPVAWAADLEFVHNGKNLTVAEDGKYFIILELTMADGKVSKAVVKLEKAA